MTVHSRTRSKAEPLLARGRCWADDPQATAEASDVIFTMVGYPADVRQVVLLSRGAIMGCRPGCVLVDMSTSQPSLAVEIAAAARERGVASVDAPSPAATLAPAGAAFDHGRRRCGRDRIVAAVFRGDGQDDRPPRRPRGRAARQNGQPNPDRLEHGRCLRGAFIRVQGRIGPGKGLALGRVGGGGELVLVEPCPADDRRQFRPRLLCRSLRQGPGHSARGIAADGPCLARAGLTQQLYLALQAAGHGRDGTQALALALANLSGIDWKGR